MTNKRKVYNATFGNICQYRYINTSNADGATIIYIKKRLFGFLWWIFVKDINGCPISYNKMYDAIAFMESRIGYYDHLHHTYNYDVNDQLVTSVHIMTDDVACAELTKKYKEKYGEEPEPDCVLQAWIFDNREFIHIALKYLELWMDIYKCNNKKLWLKQ